MDRHGQGNTRLSVLVVNYNGADLIAECLRSLRPQLGEHDEVIVVDNASSDGSDDLIERDFPWVRLIRAESNLGFTGGNNLAAEYAQGELLLLLNNDASISSGLESALKRFDDPAVSVVGANIHYPNGQRQPSIGYEHTPSRMVLSWLGRRLFSGRFSRTVDNPEVYEHDVYGVDWLSGAALLTRAETWRTLGGLDDRYFMYMEDVDYCRRVREQGGRLDYCQAFQVCHHEAGGRLWVGEKALLRSANSYSIYLHKFYPSWRAFPARLALSVIFFLRALLFGLLSCLRRDDVTRQKRRGYRRAAMALLRRRG